MIVWSFWHLAKPIQIQEFACKIQTSKHGSTKRENGWDRQSSSNQSVEIPPCISIILWLSHPWAISPSVAATLATYWIPWARHRGHQALEVAVLSGVRLWKHRCCPELGFSGQFISTFQHFNIKWWMFCFGSQTSYPHRRWFRTRVGTYPP